MQREIEIVQSIMRSMDRLSLSGVANFELAVEICKDLITLKRALESHNSEVGKSAENRS